MTLKEFGEMTKDHSFNQSVKVKIDTVSLNTPIDLINSAYQKFFNFVIDTQFAETAKQRK